MAAVGPSAVGTESRISGEHVIARQAQVFPTWRLSGRVRHVLGAVWGDFGKLAFLLVSIDRFEGL